MRSPVKMTSRPVRFASTAARTSRASQRNSPTHRSLPQDAAQAIEIVAGLVRTRSIDKLSWDSRASPSERGATPR